MHLYLIFILLLVLATVIFPMPCGWLVLHCYLVYCVDLVMFEHLLLIGIAYNYEFIEGFVMEFADRFN